MILQEEGFQADKALVLDLGSGPGNELHRFTALGCMADAVVSVDLIQDRAIRGRREHPGTPFLCADGARLPFRDGQFDLVHQDVMVSSVPGRASRRDIAREMVRVTRRGGLLVWYDLRYPNPFNRRVRPISRIELRDWFGDCRQRIHSITLILPLARRLSPISIRLRNILAAIPFLRSHLLAVFRKE